MTSWNRVITKQRSGLKVPEFLTILEHGYWTKLYQNHFRAHRYLWGAMPAQVPPEPSLSLLMTARDVSRPSPRASRNPELDNAMSDISLENRDTVETAIEQIWGQITF